MSSINSYKRQFSECQDLVEIKVFQTLQIGFLRPKTETNFNVETFIVANSTIIILWPFSVFMWRQKSVYRKISDQVKYGSVWLTKFVHCQTTHNLEILECFNFYYSNCKVVLILFLRLTLYFQNSFINVRKAILLWKTCRVKFVQ